jgi:hypothetical protein
MPHRRALQLAAVLVFLLISVAAASGVAAAAHQVAVRTRVHVVNPVTSTELAAGYHVVRRSPGTCQSSSGVMTGRGYRCLSTTTHVIYDPCFAEVGRFADTVVCPLEPWGTAVVALQLRQHAPHHTASTVSLETEPWGLELASGQRCISLGMTMHNTFRGRLVDYYCGRHVHVGVLHGLDQSKQPWTAAVVVRDRGGRRTLAHVAISDVWYGQGEPAATARSLPFTGPADLGGLALGAVLALGVGAGLIGLAWQSRQRAG